jgi:hypothetical protein
MRRGNLGRAQALAQKVFGDLAIGEIAGQIRAMYGVPLPLRPEVLGVLERRRAQLQDVARIPQTLIDDKFKDGYSDGFTWHAIGIKKSGIAARMPKEKRQRGGVAVSDEKAMNATTSSRGRAH